MTQNYVNNPLWADFKEELECRIIRAQNEPIDDMDWFIECAMNELIPLAEKAVTSLQQEKPKVDLDLEKVWDWIDKTFTETEIDSRYGESINIVMIEACKSDLREKYERDFGVNARKEE